MRKILLAASALCVLATGTAAPAAAADLRLPVYKGAPLCPSCDWGGLYVGGTLGYSKETSSTAETWNWFNTFPTGSLIGVGAGPFFATAAPTSFSTTFSNQYHHDGGGIIGGLQAGYNVQTGSFVIGLEYDWSWTHEKDSTTYSAQPLGGIFPPLPNFFFIPLTSQGWTSEQKLDWITTLRGRLGWAHDCYLWYFTGGVAWAKIEHNYTLVSSPGNPGLLTAAGGVGPGTFAQFGLFGPAAASFSTVKAGWVLGGGVETAIGALLGPLVGLPSTTNKLTAKFEYLFADFGNVNNAFGTAQVPVCGNSCAPAALVTGSTSFTSLNHVYEHIIRVGVNYKLGGR